MTADPAKLLPEWLDPHPWLDRARSATPADVRRALESAEPQEADLAALLSPAATPFMEAMAVRARALTSRHFGRTISLYVPLYLSDYCSGGCVYCGFAADRPQARHRLESPDIVRELTAIKAMGFEEVLLLTGERTPKADFTYLRDAVAEAARYFHAVTVEAFPMTTEEYRQLAEAGCVGVTLYQETYDPVPYERLHRWGPKRDYAARLAAPARALAGGMRWAGLGALLGISDPYFDMLALYRHVRRLRHQYWQAGVSISFPRVRPQEGDYAPPCAVSERFLAQIIFAFRICCPDVPLAVSTRENARFRDGIAGVGANKMSIASLTTVGGYGGKTAATEGQFEVSDDRDVATFCTALHAKGLEPVFKNWDRVYGGRVAGGGSGVEDGGDGTGLCRQ
jgi:2-iminoacetate synthase